MAIRQVDLDTQALLDGLVQNGSDDASRRREAAIRFEMNNAPKRPEFSGFAFIPAAGLPTKN